MFLLRLDDATEHWNKGNWIRIHDLCEKYGVKPIVAIIPKNEDPELLCYPVDDDFWDRINCWIKEGWTPALHGCNHLYTSDEGGINPVNYYSEFAGLPFEAQREKIVDGYLELKARGISPSIFVAPAHTFDLNTIKAIKECTPIRVISDTIASNVYFKDGLHFLPQQSGSVRDLKFPLTTFCYHPNVMDDGSFDALELFLSQKHGQFKSYNDIKLFNRRYSLFDKAISFGYFTFRKFRNAAKR